MLVQMTAVHDNGGMPHVLGGDDASMMMGGLILMLGRWMDDQTVMEGKRSSVMSDGWKV